MSCPACRKDGKRVAVWVPASRPRTARAAASIRAASEDQDQDEARELAVRWERESLWAGKVRQAPGRPGDKCPECSGPLTWEPGRTRTLCPECQRVELPAAVADHYERQAQRREVAVRAAPDKAAGRAARARLRALKDQIRHRVNNWLETIADEDCYDRSQWQRQARELAAMLRGYLPEITDAGDEDELTEVWQEISALITSGEGQALRAEYDEAQERAERQYEAQERAAEYERIERERAEQERAERERAEQEAARREIEQARQRKAITSGTVITRRPKDSDPALAALAQMAEAMRESRERRDQEIAARGQCGFRHRLGPVAAARLFGVPARDSFGRMTGYAVANTPQYRACGKHYEAAERQLTRKGYSDVCYWDL